MLFSSEGSYGSMIEWYSINLEIKSDNKWKLIQGFLGIGSNFLYLKVHHNIFPGRLQTL